MPFRAIAIADDDTLVGHLNPGPVDLLLCLGDLWDSSLEKAYLRYTPKAALAVKGNHDSDAPFPHFIKPLHNTVEHFGGLSIGGFNGSWRYKPRGHHLFEQEEVTRMLRDFPKVDVFVAHNSPAKIHERDDHVHQGFEAFWNTSKGQNPATSSTVTSTFGRPPSSAIPGSSASSAKKSSRSIDWPSAGPSALTPNSPPGHRVSI